MVWGATSKEAEDGSFFEEIPRVAQRFRYIFALCVVLAGGMALAIGAPPLWRIEYMTAIFPLSLVVVCHFLLPTALNPNLTLFTW